jgi:hypothetical protein
MNMSKFYLIQSNRVIFKMACNLDLLLWIVAVISRFVCRVVERINAVNLHKCIHKIFHNFYI